MLGFFWVWSAVVRSCLGRILEAALTWIRFVPGRRCSWRKGAICRAVPRKRKFCFVFQFEIGSILGTMRYLHCSAGVGVITRDISGHSRVPVSLVILTLIKYYELYTLNSYKKELLIYSC